MKPISWVYVHELDISFRWIQGDGFHDVLRGRWSNFPDRKLPMVERVPTRVRTWVDDTDIYAETNRYLREKYPKWFSRFGPLCAPYSTQRAAKVPEQPVRRQAAKTKRSTDFVRR